MGSKHEDGVVTDRKSRNMARISPVTSPPHSRVDHFQGSAAGRYTTFLAFLSATSLLLSLFIYSAATAAVRPSVHLFHGVKLFTHSSKFHQYAVLAASRNSTKSKNTVRNSVAAGHDYSSTLNWRLRHSSGASTNVAPNATATVAFLTTTSPTRNSTSTNSVRTPVNAAIQLGVYVGPLDPSGVKSFAKKTNTKLTIASDYLTKDEGWNGMDGANGSIHWLANAWKKSRYTLSLGVPIIPTNSSGQPQGSLAAGASGRYNGFFRKLASNLVANGEKTAYLRLGWEFDGNWYAWRAQSTTAEAEFASYFRQIVTAMRSVRGEAFKFVWNPDASAFGSRGYPVTAAYPGSAYVDEIGLELYDWNWGPPETPQAAWKNTFLPQLSAAERFARSMGRPLSLDEWGVVTTNSHGFGDDPYFISQMIKWMKSPSHDVAYESYFNGNTLSPGGSPNVNLIGGKFPQSLSTFASTLG